MLRFDEAATSECWAFVVVAAAAVIGVVSLGGWVFELALVKGIVPWMPSEVAIRSLLLTGLSAIAFAALVFFAESARRRGQRKGRALDLSTLALDSAQVAITRADGVILLWSRGCEQLYGWSEAEALATPKYALLGSRCEQPGVPGLPRATGVNELELIERCRDGTEISVLECSFAIERPGHEPLIAVTMTDISRRVESAALLRLSEARLRSIFKATPNPMIVLDEGGAIVEFSPAAERLWGYAAADVRGQPLSILTAPEDYGPLGELLARQLRSAANDPATCGVSATGVTQEGKKLSLEVSGGRADTPCGALVTLYFRDVSASLHAEQRIAELSAELAHVSRQSAMSELAADLAHELNQPLSSTANFLGTARILIERGEKGDHVADLLRMAEEQTHRSGDIIRNLRDFLAKRDVEMRPESLGHIVHESIALVLFGRARGERPTLRLDTTHDMVFVNRIQVQQVLVNLLRNAVEAQRAQPAASRAIIIASCPSGPGMVEVSVRDFGPGLPVDFSQRLQQRFATSKHGVSMGIGLSISRRIIEAHGGTLTADNMPGGGAAFRFTLPVEQALMDLEEATQ